MPYEITWYIPNHLIMDRLYGKVTIDEVGETSRILAEMLKRDQPLPYIHMIVDVSDMIGIPEDMNLERVKVAMEHMSSPTLGWTLLITTSTVARFIATIAVQVMRQRYRAFATVEEAVAFLAGQDPHVAERLPDRQPAQQSADDHTPTGTPSA